MSSLSSLKRHLSLLRDAKIRVCVFHKRYVFQKALLSPLKLFNRRVMLWYEKFGWTTDPFSTRPNENLVGLDKEKNVLLNYIHSGTISVLTGPTSAGRTG